MNGQTLLTRLEKKHLVNGARAVIFPRARGSP